MIAHSHDVIVVEVVDEYGTRVMSNDEFEDYGSNTPGSRTAACG